MNAPAPEGGTLVSLATTNAALSIPVTVTVAPGQTSATFSVATTQVAVTATGDVTATLASVTKTVTGVEVRPRLLNTLTVPTVLVENRIYTGSVGLTGPAGIGGFVVALTSSDSVLPIPATLTVPQGLTSVTFTLTPNATTVDVPVTITATAGAVTKTGSTTVQPFGVSSVSFTQSSLTAGSNGSISFSLNAPSPAGGTVVTLDLTGAKFWISNNCAGTCWGPRTTVTVNEGQTAAGSIPSGSVDWLGTPGTATVTASAGRRAASAAAPISAGSFTAQFSLSQVKRGQSANLILDFLPECSPWEPSVTVGLTSSDPSVFSVPAQAEAPGMGGSITCSSNFKAVLNVARPGLTGNVTVTVSYGGAQATAVLTVLPAGLSSLTVTPSATTQDVTGEGLVQLDSPASTGGTVVQLTSSDPNALWVPSSVTVPAGQAWAAFEVRGGSVGATTPVTVTATQDGASLTSSVTVLRPGAGRITGTVADAGKLDGDFPLAGATVSVVNGPASVVTDVSGAFSLYSDPGTVRVLISKTNYVSGASAPLALSSSGTASAGVVKLTRQMTGTYAFDGFVVDTNGAAIAGATVQAEGYAGIVTTDAGGRFRVRSPEMGNRLRLTVSKAGFLDRTENIRATGPAFGGILYLDVFVLSTTARPVLDGFRLSSTDTRYPGGTGMHFSFVGGPYPSSGVEVWRTFSNTEAVEAFDIAPLSGSYDPRWDAVLLKARGVAKVTPVVIRASYGGVTKEATLTVHPPGSSHMTSLKLDPPVLTSGLTGTATVTIDPAAEFGDLVAVTAAGPVSVPAYVSFASGVTTVTFPVTAQTVSSSQTATVTATLWGVTLQLQVPVSPGVQSRMSGIGPAGVVAGTTVAVWGTGFSQTERVEAQGPVYLPTGGTALCTVPACPVNDLPASLEASGTSLLTLVPSTLTPGIYWVRTKNGATYSQNGSWLMVDDSSVTYASLLPEERSLARPLRSGKTVIGEFVENGDPYGQTGDYALYYFTGTAGSRVSLFLEREDTSKTWEHPESLDPELVVAGPSGYVTAALFSEDIRPSVDLNAKIEDVTLPETGMYVVTAETSRGKGRYRLKCDRLSVAPSVDRSISVSGQGVTLRANDGA